MSVFNTRRQLTLAAAVAGAATAAAIGVATGASAHPSRGNDAVALRAYLTGFQEVPSLNSPGRAILRATMTPSQITYTLTYANLSAPPTMAHIHVGQPGVDGGVSVFFCGGGGKPACPTTTSGTVTGTIGAADVIGPTAQGFQAGDLASLERAIRAGVTYTNMHTPTFPNGEIRGQISVSYRHSGH
jgi:CHRD domain